MRCRGLIKVVTDHPGTTDVPAVHAGRHRDLRLDACRGLALWFIYIDHIPDNSLTWLTLRNYGFSDTSEVFVSGYTCMLACGENSLSMYCLGVLLSFVAHVILVQAPGGFAMQLAVSVTRIAAMVVAATLLTWESRFDRRGPNLF